MQSVWGFFLAIAAVSTALAVDGTALVTATSPNTASNTVSEFRVCKTGHLCAGELLVQLRCASSSSDPFTSPKAR